ncbi:MAG: condensation domain-containing protein, partial [Byssovorax sp.]
HVAPRGPVEEGRAAIFAEVLRREDVGARDGFFELGGHSLLAAQAIARVRAAFGVELPLRAIFEAPTVAELGARVEAALGGDHGLVVPPIVPVPRDGALALSFAQERMWFLAQLEPGDPSYVVPLTLRLEGALVSDALARALTALVERHEVLRTTFLQGDEGPSAVVHPSMPVPLALTSVTDRDPALREREVRAAMAEDMRIPIDLERGPLLRARVFALGVNDHLLALTMDHIVADAWTLGILRSEIGALYEAALAGRPAGLPDLPVQYADYAAWQRRWLTGEVLDRQLVYWKQQLDGAPTAIDLPTDRPRPPVPSHRGGRCGFSVSPEVSRAITALSRRRGVTLFMTLLAAFDVLLYRITGQTDLVVGMPAVNRGRVETERMVGVFLNTLVLRTQVDPALAFEALLDRVRETCLGAYAHQDMPFERLVAELARTRDGRVPPLFQVMFTLHNAPSEAVKMGELRARGAGVEVVSAKFDLTLGMGETAGGGLAGSFEYATDLFDAATIAHIAASFCALLEGIVQAPAL